MLDFAAIDFETANSERSSVCSVGVVIVRGGEIVDSFYSNQTIITIGVHRFTDCVVTIPTMRPFSLKFGNRLSR